MLSMTNLTTRWVLAALSALIVACSSPVRPGELLLVVRNATRDPAEVSLADRGGRDPGIAIRGCSEQSISFFPEEPWVISVDGQDVFDSEHGISEGRLTVDVTEGAVSIWTPDSTPEALIVC